MLTNLLIAITFIIISTVFVLNFTQFFAISLNLLKRISLFIKKSKILIETLSRAYLRYRKHMSDNLKFGI